MSAIHFVGGEKGGVGKSVVARLLSQYFIDNGHPYVAFDADRSNATLSRYYEDFTDELDLDHFESIDALMEQATDGKGEVLIDLPAQSQRFIDRWVDENGVLELCDELEISLSYWYVVDDGPESVKLLAKFLEQYAGKLQVVVVRNHGCGEDFADIDKILAQLPSALAARVRVVDLPGLHPETMRKINKMALSFWAALNVKEKPVSHLTMMERQRSKVWIKKAYAAFESGIVGENVARAVE